MVRSSSSTNTRRAPSNFNLNSRMASISNSSP
jgi:hypothetical protein